MGQVQTQEDTDYGEPSLSYVWPFYLTREYKHVDGVVQTSDISENGTYSDLVWGEGAAIRVQSGNVSKINKGSERFNK